MWAWNEKFLFAGLWGCAARPSNPTAHCNSCSWSVEQKGHWRGKESLKNCRPSSFGEGREHCDPCFWWDARSSASRWSSSQEMYWPHGCFGQVNYKMGKIYRKVTYIRNLAMLVASSLRICTSCLCHHGWNICLSKSSAVLLVLLCPWTMCWIQWG